MEALPVPQKSLHPRARKDAQCLSKNPVMGRSGAFRTTHNGWSKWRLKSLPLLRRTIPGYVVVTSPSLRNPDNFPIAMLRHLSYSFTAMSIDYVRLLTDLVEEREAWSRKRDDAERELSRLSELIRSTVKMLSPEQRSKCDCEILLERLDHRPPGLTTVIRRAFSAGRDWLTPTEIRDYLKNIGFDFERYKANPLASIHTTLRRMVPHEVESKTLEGRKIYRLKTVEQWRSSFEEAGQWLEQNGVDLKQQVGRAVVVKQESRRSDATDKKAVWRKKS